jgi:hypothetical protein
MSGIYFGDGVRQSVTEGKHKEQHVAHALHGLLTGPGRRHPVRKAQLLQAFDSTSLDSFTVTLVEVVAPQILVLSVPCDQVVARHQ